MTITQERKQELTQSFQKSTNDTGSIEVQCAVMTERIKNLTQYSKKYKKDIPAKRRLLQLAAIRRRFLKYLKANDNASYQEIIKKLAIRPV
jgi:small subunit ribosomal protein S15